MQFENAEHTCHATMNALIAVVKPFEVTDHVRFRSKCASKSVGQHKLQEHQRRSCNPILSVLLIQR